MSTTPVTPERPIQLEPLYGLDDEGVCAVYARGHHDPTTILVRTQFEYEREIRRAEVPPKATHEWWRKMPMRGNIVADTQILMAKPHARGAFPVTVVTIREWER